MCAWAKSADGGPSSSTPHGPSARSHTLARCGADRRARAVSLYMHVVLLTCGAPGQSLVVPRQLRRLHVGPLRQVRPQPIRPPPPGSARGARHESLVLDLRSPRSHLAPDSKADPWPLSPFSFASLSSCRRQENFAATRETTEWRGGEKQGASAGEFATEPPSTPCVVPVTFTRPEGRSSAASRVGLVSATPGIPHRSPHRRPRRRLPLPLQYTGSWG
jgi:hypothetical protein